MRNWSLSIGRYFGIEVRLHPMFALLLPLMMLLSPMGGSTGSRGMMLWLLLLAAVLVRETGRGIAAAALGSAVDRLVLLPTGAVHSPAINGSNRPYASRILALAGPLANFLAGITLALLMFAATSHIRLFEQPWFGPSHLVRSAIWAQVMLGGLNLLPAFPLDAGVLLQRQFQRVMSGDEPSQGVERAARALTMVSQVTASVLILAGAGLQNTWLFIMGATLLLSSRGEARTVLATRAAETVTVADVMLNEFMTISASETLSDALRRTVHSLQDVFPVVRGSLVVGAISRETILQALRADGDGYLQSAMTRAVEVANPDDQLMSVLRRVQYSRGAQLLPVVKGDAVIGILTPSNLSHSMGLLGRTRRALDRNAETGGDA